MLIMHQLYATNRGPTLNYTKMEFLVVMSYFPILN